MNIIKPGKLPGDKHVEKVSTCPTCGTKFSYRLAEAEVPADEAGKATGAPSAIYCPFPGCGYRMELGKDGLPVKE